MKIYSSELYEGQLVVVNTGINAQVYTIAHIHKRQYGSVFAVTVAWNEGTRFCYQTMSQVFATPTIEQIEYTINNNSPLATLKQIKKNIPDPLQERKLALQDN